jgi:hypothetical protein
VARLPVHVSIHDVSPAFAAEVTDALAMCHDAGARPSLLVVPDFHGEAPLLRDEAMCGRLRALQEQGHDVYLHGLVHRSSPVFDGAAPGGRLAWLFSQRVVSGGEAEMSDVTPAEGRARLAEGEQTLARAGLTIDGYVAPAWSMPRWLLPVLAERAYRFTEDHLRVHDPVTGASRATILLNWASRTPGRLLTTVGFNRVARYARALVPARIAIHPADMRVLLLRREVERLLSWAKGDFVARGADLLPHR